MLKLMERWSTAEPVRLYLYGILLAALAVAVGYGLLSAELLPLWIALGAAVLMAPGVEGARRRVTPTRRRAVGPGRLDRAKDRRPGGL